MLSAGCDCMGGARSSCVVCSTDDVLEMSVLRELRGVGGVFEIYVFAPGRGGRCGGEWVKRLDLGFTNPVGTVAVWDICLCLGSSGVGGSWWPGTVSGMVGWCCGTV